VATGNALFAFVTNRGGDAGFLLLGLSASWLGSFDWRRSITGRVDAGQRPFAGPCFNAALASAQLPFTPWMVALEGLRHQRFSTVRHGSYRRLLLRLSPLLAQVQMPLGWWWSVS
jgi:hypothetical protein